MSLGYKVSQKEAIEYLEDGFDIHVEVGESVFKIADMHGYVGAPDDGIGWISEYLGNVYYEHAETIVKETVSGMKDGKDVEAIFYVDM